MKIDRLEVNGFGRLRGHDLKFGPTINVIAGPNEAGKSTLAEALQALLFGLTDGATSPAPNKLRQQFKPWNEGQFGGSIWVRLQNDRDYRIVRNFSQSATKVYREPGATDVTNQYISGKHGWVDFADRHLGMSRSVFRVSGWIDQAQLFYTSQQRVTLTGQLNNLVGAPNDGMSAQDALARLSNWLRDRINPAAHAVENSPYRKAERRVLELRAELEQSRDVLEELDQLIVDQRALEEKLQDDEVDLARIDALLAARELADIQKKLTRLATIEKDLTDIRTALKELDDVAQLEPRWFTAADQALADVERGKAGVETAQGVVAGEREAYESALGELEKIDQDSAQLPDVGEERLSAVEEVVRSWDTASQRQSDLDNALAEARQRLESKELVAAERLSNLGSDTTADDLGAAIRSIETASQRLSDARADQERVTLAPADEIEYDRLSQQIGELTGTSLGELEQRAHRLELARQQNAASGSQTPLLVGLAILVGFGLGFALLGGLGAAIGAVIGGIVGFLVAGALIKTGRGSESQMVAKNADLLAADLKRYGVESIGELRALWDRRNELVGKVNQIRASRTRINERQADLERALAGLVQVAGTRDLEQASQLERELRQDQLDLQNLRQGFADAERLMVDAAKEAAARSAEARRQLVLLGIAVENPSEAHRALGQIRATQVKRRDLLQRKAELSGEVQLYAAREDALERCQSELDGCDARLASAFEKVGLVLPLADPAMSLAEVHGRFGKYQDLRTREQNLGASRDALIGGDDPADWLRQKEMLAERAGSADLVDERSREELEAHRAAVRRERDVKTRLLSDVEAKLAAAMRQIREPSIIEEELAEAERRYRELDRLKNALEGAKQALTQVTVDFQRDFAPRLESRVGKTLAQITAGRYGEVSIDPVDLAIRINSFERTDLVELDGLSHGTRDAIALLLRASVAQLLSNNAEPVPLFLDDPLVHVDSDRTRRVFDVLQELSEEWQIFYFTQDERVVEWARRSGGSVKLCELPPPSPRSAVS